MDQFIDKVSTPIRRFLSRGLSLPTLSTFSRTPSSVNGGDQTPLPSAGKRQREESEEEDEEGPMKRVKMDIDEPSPVTAPDAAPSREESATVETIRPGVEGLSLAPGTPPPSNGRTRSAQSSPDSKKTRYQRGLRGTRKSAAADTPSPSKARLGPKRQCALLISFCGSGYSGMQIQKDAKTIEGALFNALVKVGSVSEDNSDDPAKVNIQRAARTDAGVHAARNLVSIKAIMELPGVTDLVGLLNKHLPEEIHVWDIVRTQNSFNARTSCDSRKYTYFMPTYMLLPPAPASLTANALLDVEEGAYDVAKHPFWKSVANQPITPESTLFMLRKKWRIDEETVSRFRAVLQEYIGTHNFWNFTIGREFKEAAAHRHMKSIEVSDPAIYGETEWLSVQIHGQSFMLHQIVGLIAPLCGDC
ncbi:tRNA pseudouridine synthase 1 [Serendipita sp. 401]|nr:tRNA pseudouridine synthase 1 [Serendipita sp. 401]